MENLHAAWKILQKLKFVCWIQILYDAWKNFVQKGQATFKNM